MELVVVGINHRRASVELREKLAFADAALPAALDALRAAAGSSEELILSTCNRVEIYLANDDPAPPGPAIARFLAAKRGVDEKALDGVLYTHTGADAVRHLFRVASSIDSMVLGETQIIAQVKAAYLAAQGAGHTGRLFNPLFQRALHVAKRIHSETSIGEKNVSVSSVAAKLAQKVFQDLSTKRAMVLGAGETGTLTLEAFKERGIGGVLVVNRTLDHAKELVAKVGGEAHPLDRLDEVLPRADVVIACLSGGEFVLTPERMAAAMKARRNEPMFLIDIAVPRNVNPGVNRLDNVYLFNIDDLEGIVNQNLSDREREIGLATPIIEHEAAAMMTELQLVDVERVLVRLRDSVHSVGKDELKRTLDRMTDLSAAQRDEIGQMVNRILNKVLHAPTTKLKEESHNGLGPDLIELATRLFGLNK